jgi:hypothetical protein
LAQLTSRGIEAEAQHGREDTLQELERLRPLLGFRIAGKEHAAVVEDNAL